MILKREVSLMEETTIWETEMFANVPDEVCQVESHLRWILEVPPYLESSALERSDTMADHIRLLMRKREENYYEDGVEAITDDNFEEEYNEQNPKFCSIYASRLNEATTLAYIFQFDAALSKLELLRRIYDRLEKCHVAAFKYCVDALTWAIKVMKNLQLQEDDTLFVSGEELCFEEVENPDGLQERWKELQKDNKARAVFRYVWGCLGGSLKITEEFLLEVFHKVVELDPDYHIWYAEVYRKMRSNRRNIRRQECGMLKEPSEEEQRMCKEAYYRNPDIYLSIKDMGIMMKETMWTQDQAFWDNNEDRYLQCKRYFEQALDIATSRNQRNWMRKIQVYLAEFLLFGRGNELDQEEGKRLFDKCVEENPEDSTVLHKVGKLCHYGAATKSPSNERKYQNRQLAEGFYQHALKADSTNYPCLKDYLRLLKSGNTKKDYEKYVLACDSAINDMKRDYQLSDLKILRGCVIWIYNPFDHKNYKEEACESWLYVVNKLPDYQDRLYAEIKKPTFFIGRGRNKRPASISTTDLVSSLKRMKLDCPIKNEIKLYAIQNFIENLIADEN